MSIRMITPAEFARALQSWHLEQPRSYPWRISSDPYQILVALTMLQQAPASKVEKTFYPKFLAKFPTIESLAQAKWSNVFPLWHGLGSYSKGKNLLRIAKEIVVKFEGQFPEDKKNISTLPGLTPMMTDALLCFAWDHPIALIDPSAQKIISLLWPQCNVTEKAQELILAAKSSRDWNNAMRDLCNDLKAGKNINGELGVLLGEQVKKAFPQTSPKKEKTAKPTRKHKKFRIEVGAACIHKDGKYLIQTRPTGKSFVGRWEFPGGKREKGETFEECVKREIIEEIGINVSVKPHFCEILQEFERTELLLRFHICEVVSGNPVGREGQELRWVSPKKFHGLPFLDTNSKCIEMLKKMHE